MKHTTPAKGFTLLEVLIATTVIAFALSAIIRTVGTSASNTSYLRDKTFAHWVALNQMAELRAANKYPRIGRKQGDEELANREWYWTAEVKKTPEKDMRRVEISVRTDTSKDSQALITIAGFFAKYRSSKTEAKAEAKPETDDGH